MKDLKEIMAWRAAMRRELIERRAAIEPAQRREWGERITAWLVEGFSLLGGKVVAFCWPYKGEFDARFAVRYWRERGATAALPEVVAKGQPLRFRKWWPGAPTTPGVYNIPVPAGTEVVVPDAAIVPMNGFDAQGYRLGYGGAYFDRTLAALHPRLLTVGVAFEFARLETIFPQAHDIPMDFVLTEVGIYRGGGRVLAPLDPSACVAEARSVLEQRRGPPPSKEKPVRMEAAPLAAGYSSPACYAHEVAPGYFGEEAPMSREEVLKLLNTLLEAERAGAKAIAALLEDHAPDTPAWRQLAAVQRDEARNCVNLIELIRGAGGTPSNVTGDFLQKVLKIEGVVPRLQFLNRGQGWVARTIAEALPHLEDEGLQQALRDMHESHLLNIEACEALIETLAP